MSAQKTLSDPSLQRLRNNIIASIAFRGTRPEQTKIGGVISKLFELYEDDP